MRGVESIADKNATLDRAQDGGQAGAKNDLAPAAPKGSGHDLRDWVELSAPKPPVKAAYRTDVEQIDFGCDVPGLTIKWSERPAKRGSSMQGLETFHLVYDPKQFARGSLARRAFGTKPLELDFADVASAQRMMLLSQDGWFTMLNLKATGGSALGVGLLVSRDTGRIQIYPPTRENPVTDFLAGLVAEAQQRLGQQFAGEWTAGDR